MQLFLTDVKMRDEPLFKMVAPWIYTITFIVDINMKIIRRLIRGLGMYIVKCQMSEESGLTLTLTLNLGMCETSNNNNPGFCSPRVSWRGFVKALRATSSCVTPWCF